MLTFVLNFLNSLVETGKFEEVLLGMGRLVQRFRIQKLDFWMIKSETKFMLKRSYLL